MGLRRHPDVRLSFARVGPLVWPIGRRPTVLLPQGLVQSLPEHELELLIAHEFAHIKRRDHQVRWFELGMSALYWWYPVYWIARKQLRKAEEYCCDAMVLELISRQDASSYANVLLKVAEFAADMQSPTPRLASGAGSSSPLKWRIEMVLSNSMPGRLSRSMKLIIAIAAIVVSSVSVVEFQ